MKVLILGGAGFIGRHAALALQERGHTAVLASRDPRRCGRRLPLELLAAERREAHLDWLTAPSAWNELLRGIDCVVNAAGILRERGFETYERVHYRAPRALAEACARKSIRLIHLSALGLTELARSGFLRSKLAGERAIMASRADWSIVRPSLLDGEGGFGARWLRQVARWPLHLVPADARGQLAALDVRDLAEAIAVLCEKSGADGWREVELGGGARRTLAEHLAALRCEQGFAPAPVIPLPGALVRLASRLCDLAHFSPLSYGLWELMRRDNAPKLNVLPALIRRAPAPVGQELPAPVAGLVDRIRFAARELLQ
jgi:NADH dehydrogenase